MEPALKNKGGIITPVRVMKIFTEEAERLRLEKVVKTGRGSVVGLLLLGEVKGPLLGKRGELRLEGEWGDALLDPHFVEFD
jgi:hypothetical protein